MMSLRWSFLTAVQFFAINIKLLWSSFKLLEIVPAGRNIYRKKTLIFFDEAPAERHILIHK